MLAGHERSHRSRSHEVRAHATAHKHERLNHIRRFPVFPSSEYETKFSKTYLNKEKHHAGAHMLLYYLAAIFKGLQFPLDDICYGNPTEVEIKGSNNYNLQGSPRIFQSNAQQKISDPSFQSNLATPFSATAGIGGKFKFFGFIVAQVLQSRLLQNYFNPRTDDDFVDKLNYHYTSAMLFAFAIVVSAKQYVGYPIQCWVPAQFTDAWEQYTENYCWVQSTYFHSLSGPFVEHREWRRSRTVGYYQWVPFILAVEALMFYIPCIIWRGLLNWYSGINVQGLTQMACDARLLDRESRSATVETIAGHIDDALEVQRDLGNRDLRMKVVCSNRCNAYVTVLYLIIKVLYVANVLAQVFLLNFFLGADSWFYGLYIIKDILSGYEWRESGNFPRVTMCDFEVRALGNLHHYTVQCVLMINMFNEKIFVFLWFWFMLIALLSFLSLLHWSAIMLWPRQRERFVRRYIRASDLFHDLNYVKKFVSKYLCFDGVFCLRMMAFHAGDIVTTELIYRLWLEFFSPGKSSPQVEVVDLPVVSGEGHQLNVPSIHHSGIKSWLGGSGVRSRGHRHGNHALEKRMGSTGPKRKNRRKSDGYFTFV